MLNQQIHSGKALQSKLKKRTLEMCGEEDRFRVNKIEITPLQICKDSRNLETMQKMGHYHHKKDIVKTYSENIRENILPKQLFNEAQRHAKETSRNNSTDEAKKKTLSHIRKFSAYC